MLNRSLLQSAIYQARKKLPGSILLPMNSMEDSTPQTALGSLCQMSLSFLLWD